MLSESCQATSERERIDRGVAEAFRDERSIGHVTARAIATQLYASCDTPLYALAATGAVTEGLADELSSLRNEGIPPELESWLDALDRYLVARADTPESVAGWHELSPDDLSQPEGQQNHPSIRPLPEYEPAPQPAVPASSKSRSAAFQLALDLQWARNHRPKDLEGRVAPLDVGNTRRILAAAVDVIAGRRPAAQIRDQLGPIALAAVQTRAREAVRTGQGLRLCSVHTYQPAKGVIEACGTVDTGRRYRALIARLETGRSGWQCTMLRLL
ncbi:hypothetical protein JOF56_003057 [Kibdelosporangium banguiense]|uniref:DUF222 domain-containing protein n=1 Tax=Kibdelosporangium banguiense TaxID=1365924 RepID=A0ABS4TE29_9PSEU|nr:Rv3235 family protein [Kibdelosporangium banguiense]MBP2322672.1 hypothetical protein [Kibdelosporangium banguiense]